MDHVDDAVVGDLPARLQPENGERVALLGTEEAQSSVRHVVRLEIELVERRQQLRNGADRVVGHVDTVVDAERNDFRVEAGPEAGLGDLIAP